MPDVPHLKADNILFVFIDLQHRLLRNISNGESIIDRNLMLLEAAILMDVPYVVTTQYRKGLGELTPRLAEKIPSVIDKTCFSCVGEPLFGRRFKSLQKDWTVISGVETHICVMQTTLDLLSEGYHVAVVSDAVAARGQENHSRGLRRMENSGALIVTTEMLIYELLGRSDSENFKKLLPLIKHGEVS
jgi:nicotinamidase-related amidase